MPKEHRYTLGGKIDILLAEIIETISTASFLPKEVLNEKHFYVKMAIRKNDTAKIFLFILWENKSLDIKKYSALSEKINEIGRMLGGWSGQLFTKTIQEKQNSPAKTAEEK